MQIGAVQLGPGEIAMIGAGAAVLGGGLWMLLWLRPPKGPKGPRLARIEGALIEPPRPLTEPTRLTIAVVLLILGYHLIVWALPHRLVGVQLSRERWYVWVLLGVVGIALSVVIDRLEGARDAEREQSGRGG
jgi:hypothetical protein